MLSASSKPLVTWSIDSQSRAVSHSHRDDVMIQDGGTSANVTWLLLNLRGRFTETLVLTSFCIMFLIFSMSHHQKYSSNKSSKPKITPQNSVHLSPQHTHYTNLDMHTQALLYLHILGRLRFHQIISPSSTTSPSGKSQCPDSQVSWESAFILLNWLIKRDMVNKGGHWLDIG